VHSHDFADGESVTMTTAFTYSGTGLESAIQSGSGGIGTGSSITLEVDTVPSDLSQGDTVKVALGGASDWSGGNGETAYGDIGGAGANGGTNITLTDRGQEGTTASSFSEGDPVRVGVQGRDDAGPERSIVQGETLHSQNLLVADDFDRQDGNLDGDSTPIGSYSWTVQEDSFEVFDGRARPANDFQNAKATVGIQPSGVLQLAHLNRGELSNGDSGLVIAYQDSSNWILARDSRGVFEIVESVSGTVSQVASTPTNNDTASGKITSFVGHLRGDTTSVTQVRATDHAAGVRVKYSATTDTDSIINNAVGAGISGRSTFDNFEYYKAYRAIK
jgi:hypothetical protein